MRVDGVMSSTFYIINQCGRRYGELMRRGEVDKDYFAE